MYRRAYLERPHADWILRNTVACLAGAGRMKEAAQEYERLRAKYPDLTIAQYRKAMVFSAAALDKMVENLRKAGLPE